MKTTKRTVRFGNWKKSVLVVTLALLLSSLLLTCYGQEIRPITKRSLWGKFMEGSADPLFYFLSTFSSRVLFVYSSLTPKIKGISELTYGDLEWYLLSNPQPEREVSDLIHYFISIMGPLYMAAIILLGTYLLFFSPSPLSRARAKSYLLRLILSLILISTTPSLLRLLFSLSDGLTQSVLSLAPSNFLQLHQQSVFYSLNLVQKTAVANVITALPFILFSFFITLGALVLVILRYLSILLLSALLPLAIFLFSFRPTRSIGRIILAQLFFWIFLSVSLAVALVAIALGENLFHLVLAELWTFSLGGTLALFLSPVGMFYVTRETIKVVEKISVRLTRVEERLIPELKELEGRLSLEEVESQLKEISQQGKIKKEQLKRDGKLYRQLKKEAERDERTVEELLKGRYNFKLVTTKETREEIIPSIKIKSHAPRPFTKSEKSRKGGIWVELGLGVKPIEAPLGIALGEVVGVGLTVENLTKLVLTGVSLQDQGLAENNILVSYNTNNFSLLPGATKTITVTINVTEGDELITYKGVIYVTCKEGFKNFIDIKVKILPPGVSEELSSGTKAALVELANLDGELSYADLQEDALLFKKLSLAATAQGKSLDEFVRDEYNLRLVHGEKDDLCGELSELANVDKEISLVSLKEKKELYEKISEAAKAEEKSIFEYVKEKCDLIILTGERRVERPIDGEKIHRIATYTPPEVEEEGSAKEQQQPPRKLALPAPEAPPTIISSS